MEYFNQKNVSRIIIFLFFTIFVGIISVFKPAILLIFALVILMFFFQAYLKRFELSITLLYLINIFYKSIIVYLSLNFFGDYSFVYSVNLIILTLMAIKIFDNYFSNTNKTILILQKLSLNHYLFIIMILITIWEILASFNSPFKTSLTLIKILSESMQILIPVTFFYLQIKSDHFLLDKFVNYTIILFIPNFFFPIYEILKNSNPLSQFLILNSPEFASVADYYSYTMAGTFQLPFLKNIPRIASFFIHPNQFSIYLNFILVMLIYKLTLIKKDILAYLYGSYIFIIIILQILTFSRTGMAGMFLIVITLLILERFSLCKKNKTIENSNFLMYFLIFILLIILMFTFSNLIFQRISTSDRAAGRFDLWEVYLSTIKDYWLFGIGKDNLNLYAQQLGVGFTPHNLWLTLLISSGFPDLTFFLVYYLLIIINIFFSWKSIRKKSINNNFNTLKVLDISLKCSVLLIIILTTTSLTESNIRHWFLPLVFLFSTFSLKDEEITNYRINKCK